MMVLNDKTGNSFYLITHCNWGKKAEISALLDIEDFKSQTRGTYCQGSTDEAC